MQEGEKPRSRSFFGLFNRKPVVEDEIQTMLDEASDEEITKEGKKIISSIFDFDDTLAYEIMTPRTDVFAIDINDPAENYLDDMMTLTHSRIPVYREDIDNIIGVLHIKDYLFQCYKNKTDSTDIEPLLRKAYFVPESKNIASLLFEMQKNKQQLAFLIDEYGGFSGIVTVEDIIEEIIGEIDDEFDEEETIMEKVNEKTFIVSGDATLDDLNEKFAFDLHSENSETIGGYIIEILGEIPDQSQVGKIVEIQNYQFKILKIAERRIDKVEIKVK